MAFVKLSAKEAWAKGAGDVDRERLAATTEADLGRYMIEDGEDPDGEPAFAKFTPPSEIRARLEMTQVAFAEALAVPVKTLRNWEQRDRLDPAVKTLMRIVSADPQRAFAAVHGDAWKLRFERRRATPASETSRATRPKPRRRNRPKDEGATK